MKNQATALIAGVFGVPGLFFFTPRFSTGAALAAGQFRQSQSYYDTRAASCDAGAAGWIFDRNQRSEDPGSASVAVKR